VVSEHAVRHIDAINVISTDLAGVRVRGLGALLDDLEERGEGVGVVVRSLAAQDRRDTLEAETCVNVDVRERAGGRINDS